jgi:hypothetical protein
VLEVVGPGAGAPSRAWLCTVVFGDLNGFTPDLTDDEAFHLVWDIASSSMELARIAERLHLSVVEPRTES